MIISEALELYPITLIWYNGVLLLNPWIHLCKQPYQQIYCWTNKHQAKSRIFLIAYPTRMFAFFASLEKLSSAKR